MPVGGVFVCKGSIRRLPHYRELLMPCHLGLPIEVSEQFLQVSVPCSVKATVSSSLKPTIG